MTTVFEWLNEKYVQNADERQSKMGLQYMTAETHDLAEMIYKYQKQPLLKKIAELEQMLRWYVEEDEIHEGDPENQYWIDGKHKAMKLLGMDIE